MVKRKKSTFRDAASEISRKCGFLDFTLILINTNIDGLENGIFQHLSSAECGMERSMGVTEARINFAELIDSVRYQGNTVLLITSGKPAAVVVPVEVFERWKKERKEKFDAFRRLRATVTDEIDEEEALALALEAE